MTMRMTRSTTKKMSAISEKNSDSDSVATSTCDGCSVCDKNVVFNEASKVPLVGMIEAENVVVNETNVRSDESPMPTSDMSGKRTMKQKFMYMTYAMLFGLFGYGMYVYMNMRGDAYSYMHGDDQENDNRQSLMNVVTTSVANATCNVAENVANLYCEAFHHNNTSPTM